MSCIKVKSLDTNKIGVLEDYEGELKRDQYVVIFTEEKGEDLARVLGPSREDGGSRVRFKFVRTATEKDLRKMEKNKKESEKAYKTCKVKIKEQGLDMHLLKAYVPLNSKKIFFYYTAEERVDFRKLVRELARIFKKRIEMRQVGVRDAVQILGWVGICGDVPCCLRFLESFDSISLKDIEEQNLPLSPSKFTGPCGRLICCMSFERDNYLVKHLFPERGTELCFTGQEVTLLEVDPLRGLAVLKSEEKKLEVPISELLPKDYEKVLSNCRGCKGCCRFSNGEREEYEITSNN
jgi:cell fate regulator YaaT (PSP1 superfamily)